MDCFEARNHFAALWRKRLAPEPRAGLLGHLRACARCDRAFRLFAVTGAPLYSDTVPARAEAARGYRAPSPALRASSAGNGRPAWRALCAMVAIMLAAGFAAYLSAAVPHQTLDDALSSPEPASDLAGQAELPQPFNDFAG